MTDELAKLLEAIELALWTWSHYMPTHGNSRIGHMKARSELRSAMAAYKAKLKSESNEPT
jgi:hypothetical protein